MEQNGNLESRGLGSSNKRYKFLSSLILIIVVCYISLSQLVIALGWGVAASWQPIFTGPARLEVQENILKLELNAECSVLQIRFLDPLESKSHSLTHKDNVDYSAELSSGADWITVKCLTSIIFSSGILIVADHFFTFFVRNTPSEGYYYLRV